MIRRLRITNYRAVEEIDLAVPPRGVIFSGKNGAGKSTRVNAIRAALEGRDVSPDAIRHGASKSEILVDLDHHSVRRLITPKQSTVTVTNDEGDRKAKPIAWLEELIGSGGLDPLAFYLAKPEKRREMVLSTMAVKLTAEHLGRWLPEGLAEHVVDEAMLEMHGLEALDALHKRVYEARAEVNKRAKDLGAEMDVDKRALDEMRERLPGTPPKSVEDAQRAVDVAVAKVAEEKAMAYAREVRAQHNALMQTRVEELRKSADANEHHGDVAEAPCDNDLASHREDERQAQAEVLRLETLLTTARQYAQRAIATLKHAEDLHSRAAQLKTRAAALREQADEIEKSIFDVPAPESTAMGHAEKTHADAVAELDVARTKATFDTARAALMSKRATHDEIVTRAETLTEVVDRLRTEAPTELLTAAKGIQGIGVSGKSITLDGVSIDALSGREQLRLAVDIAKRTASKAKILLCDGLERIDPDQMRDFVEFATADGWQLIGSRVMSGEIVVEAIALDDSEAAE